MTRFRADFHTRRSNDDMVSSDESENELVYSEDDEDENEPPHPLGFGKSRYCVHLEDPEESMEQYKRRHGYIYPFDEDSDLFREDYEPFMQTYPPLSHFIDPRTAPTKSLIRSSQASRAREDNEMDKITQLLQAAALISPQPVTTVTVKDTFSRMQADGSRVQQEMQQLRQQMEKEHYEAAETLKMILKGTQEKAKQVLKEQARVDAEVQQAATEEQRQEGVRQAEEVKQREKDGVAQDKLRKEKDEVDKKVRAEAEVVKAAKDAAAKESDFVGRAQKLVGQLVQVRASVEPFENSKDMTVKKRRLQMKKLVGGKINTLTENADKIRSVASDVSQAIAQTRDEDEQIKQLLNSGSNQVAPEMARGKRYLVDLLSSKVIVRIQAEGFNG
jgi:hypothetical protein